MPIYTGRGDEGQTDLRDMTRVSKTDPRIEAYGTVDELNALIGTTHSTGHDDLDTILHTVQNHLHIVQAELANPDTTQDDPHITPEHVDQLETWIDDITDDLPPLRSFILPGGGDTGSRLHHARAVCRRAERRTVNLADTEPLSTHPLVYLNRLSDLLFVAARLANHRDDVPEQPPDY